MFCDFRKAFGLDPEYNKQLEESMQEAEKKDSRESEIERTITDALLVHPATEYVRNFIFDYSSGDAVVSFIVKGAQWEEEETISTVFEKGVS